MLSGVTAIATGLAHTCALRRDGSVRCWGSNTNGSLGMGYHPPTPELEVCQ